MVIDDRTRRLQAQSNAAIKAVWSDPKQDLAMEREKCSFDSTDLAAALLGGHEQLRKRAMLVEVLKKDPVFSKDGFYHMSREQRYERALQIGLRLVEIVQTLDSDDPFADGEFMHTCIDEPLPTDLHWAMYTKAIQNLATVEQQEQWLTPALMMQHVGTYAQTELGHGTFLRGLETTATYDPATQEFILHSPTNTATKWWPGGLGKTCSHAIVMARLFTQGQDHGPHPFIVQLRDLDTHKPVAGIEVGDIGSKFGFNAIDNGFLRFDHLRVPRLHMLMRHSQVLEDGTYVAPKARKINYATMVRVRADIVRRASLSLAKAVTIAVRYSCVRRQTSADAGVKETQVLDFEHVQRTLLPLLASVYALHFAGSEMQAAYERFEHGLQDNDFSALPELHASSSGLKALCTWITADGIETCRRMCGGHGYMQCSGLVQHYGNYVAAVTYEGDNNVMMLQTARFLYKKWCQDGCKPSGHSLVHIRFGTQHEINDMIRMLSIHTDSLVNKAGMNLKAMMELPAYNADNGAPHHFQESSSGEEEGALKGVSPRAWSACNSDFIAAAKAHCFTLLAKQMRGGIDKLVAGESTRPSHNMQQSSRNALEKVCRLFVAVRALEIAPDVVAAGFAPANIVVNLESVLATCLKDVRPDAAGLVDSLALDDYYLNSCLGRQDGDVYKALYDEAKTAPYNKQQVMPAHHKIVKPVMQRSKM